MSSLPIDPQRGTPRVEEMASEVHRFAGNFTWSSVPVLAYKEEGTHFASITRQILSDGNSQLPCQIRYFEISNGGHSTLERHDHVHVVIVLRGSGHVLLGEEIVAVSAFDVVRVGSWTWHQFRATSSEPLGFLCAVSVDRDRPERPDATALAKLRARADIAAFIRV